MLKVICSNDVERLSLTKRAFFLAYNASCCIGSGFRNYTETATEEDVFNNILNKGDYPFSQYREIDETDLYADYVFGRCMKTRFYISDFTITISYEKITAQMWSCTYKSYKALFRAAAKELNIKIQFVKE